LKSQPEYPVRRLAVFGGYNHPEPAPTWSRVVKREAPRLRQLTPEPVVALEAITHPAELYRAA
jgi:hypothetical protein